VAFVIPVQHNKTVLKEESISAYMIV